MDITVNYSNRSADNRLLEAAASGQTDLVLQLLEEEGAKLHDQKDQVSCIKNPALFLFFLSGTWTNNLSIVRQCDQMARLFVHYNTIWVLDSMQITNKITKLDSSYCRILNKPSKRLQTTWKNCLSGEISSNQVTLDVVRLIFIPINRKFWLC